MTGEAEEVDRSSPLVSGQPLAETDAIYRRIANRTPNMISVDSITGVERPSSGVFKPDTDGVSCYAESALHDVGLDASDLLRRHGNLLARVDVVEVRSVDGLDAVGDPWPDPSTFQDPKEAEHPRNAAHALVVGLEGLGKADRLARQRELVKLASLTLVEPDLPESM